MNRFIRYWRWLFRERPMRFTRFGTFYILFTLGVGAAAINTGNNLLYIILGIQLSLIIVSGFLSDSGLWGLRSQWTPAQDLFAEQATTWMVRLTKGWFPAALVKISGEWRDGTRAHVWAPWIASHQTIVGHAALTPRRRGLFFLDKVRYSTAFPFGLFEKTHTERRAQAFVVYPAVYPLDLQNLLSKSGREGQARMAQRVGEGVLPWSIRDYRPGDSLRRMDWKAAAKRQRWIIKETDDDTQTSLTLAITQWPQEDAEAFISFIASVFFAAQRGHVALGLITPDAQFPPAASPTELRQLWHYLALVDPRQAVANALEIPAHAYDAQALWALHHTRVA